MPIDATHDPALQSWVASANAADTDFPIQNLPYGRFRTAGSAEPFRLGVAIGDQILDLPAAMRAAGPSPESDALATEIQALVGGDLNAYMNTPRIRRRAVRRLLSRMLAAGSPHEAALRNTLLPQAKADMALPCTIGDYTDFYAGIHHATTVGRLFRPDKPLLPNYKWVPIGYHGRSSSIVVSGHPVRRPRGQTKGEAETPVFGPTKRLDYELEVGALIGPGNALGEPIAIDSADEHIFGLVLLNDWSARDIQAWEYQPLGPFLAKNFASTISPWVVTIEALAPFRCPFDRPAGDPRPLPYLDSAFNRERGQLNITLEVWLQTPAMREAGHAAVRLTQSNFREAYWTLSQLVTHHTVGGCNLRSGDLLGSGTMSGPASRQGGSMLELSLGGRQAIELPGGETRTFLLDGDTVLLRAYCEQPGARRIGFGEAAGTVTA
jgi:fumarylacetoacetase